MHHLGSNLVSRFSLHREKTDEAWFLNNKLNPHIAPSPVIEPGTHWWETSALTSAPCLLPLKQQRWTKRVSHTLFQATLYKSILTIVLIMNVCKVQKLLKSLSFCSRVEIHQNVMTPTPAVHSLERPRVRHHELPLLHNSFVQWLSLVAFQRYSKTDH